MIDLNEYSDIGTYWVALYVNNNSVTYFDSFGVEHIPKEIKTFIGRSLSITRNIFRIQHMIRCVDISVLDLLILRLQEKL